MKRYLYYECGLPCRLFSLFFVLAFCIDATAQPANTPPSFLGGHSQTLTACFNATNAPINSLLAITDPDVGQTETWSVGIAPTHGALVVTYSTTSTGGTLTPAGLSYTPAPGYTGTDMFQVEVSDGIATDFTNVSVTVIPGSIGVITGPSAVCAGATIALSDTSAGGVWSSSDPVTAGVGPAPGIITGGAPGTALIYYSISSGCTTSQKITVNALPPAISGIANMCAGGTSITVSDASGPGVWTSSLVTITPGGVVTAATPGPAMITYTLATGCSTTSSLTVDSLPGKIIGSKLLCISTTVTFSDTSTGGNWSSFDATISVGASSGMVTAISAGTATLSYSLPTGCYVADTLTIYSTPPSITGNTSICVGATTALSDPITGGVWSSSSGGIASVGSAGLVSGLSAGTVIISYTISSACTAGATVTVMPLPTLYTVTGGGSYCAGSTGVHVLLSGSATGVKYRLYTGSLLTDSLNGTGVFLDYGSKTAAGIYKVIASDITTGCLNNMADSAAININPVVAPSVSITAAPAGTVCQGTSVTYTASPVNGGTSPGYQWKVNGINVGTGGGSYSYAPVDKDAVIVVMTSNATCAAPVTTYALVAAAVITPLTPSVTVTAYPGRSIEKGQTVAFTAVAANAGASPTYQWMKNGIVLPGETIPTYVTNALANLDSISCTVTTGGMCSSSASGKVYMNVRTDAVKSINDKEWFSILPNPNKGTFTINGSLGIHEASVSLEITDMLGQVVYRKDVSVKGASVNEQVQLPDTTPTGMYLLNVRSEHENKVFRIAVE